MSDYSKNAMMESAATCIEPRHETQREILSRKKERLTRQLGEVNEALSMLDQHPEMEEFIKVMQRAI